MWHRVKAVALAPSGRSWTPASTARDLAGLHTRKAGRQADKAPPERPGTCMCQVQSVHFRDHLWPQGTHLPSPFCLHPSPGASDVRTPAGDKGYSVESGHVTLGGQTSHAAPRPGAPRLQENPRRRSWPPKVGSRTTVHVWGASRSLRPREKLHVGN